MIQTVTYRARLDGKDGDSVLAVIRPHFDAMLAGRVELLGGDVRIEGKTVRLDMRIQGLDRWKIQAIGRRFATFIFGIAKVYHPTPISPERVETALTRNKLVYGEGRTQMARPSRPIHGRPVDSTASSESV